MSVVLSRVLLALEGLVLSVPVTIWGVVVFPVAIFDVSWSPTAIAIFVMSVAMLLFIFSAYRVMLRFIIGGTGGLRRLNPVWWWLCLAGAMSTVAAAMIVAFATSQLKQHNDLYFMLLCAAYGLPFLVPYVHVALEKFLRKAISHAV
jgi:hypothetical protein